MTYRVEVSGYGGVLIVFNIAKVLVNSSSEGSLGLTNIMLHTFIAVYYVYHSSAVTI